jgi:Spy/CpxP family protein refolding chaperone
MMRNIAIGLAAATIAIGCSTLSVSALYGQEKGISKGSMSGSAKSQHFGRRTYNEERGRGNRFAELTPRARERLREIARERYTELTPRQRERLTEIGRELYSGLTPRQRERLSQVERELYAELTPRQRERIRAIMRERHAELTPPGRERLYRHGPYGRR